MIDRLLRLPVLEQCDGSGRALQHRVDQETSVGGNVKLPPARIYVQPAAGDACRETSPPARRVAASFPFTLIAADIMRLSGPTQHSSSPSCLHTGNNPPAR